MTTIFQGVKVLTYAEWITLPSVKEMGASLDDCDVCDGRGEHKCECGNTHECPACDGAGKVENMRDIYEARLRSEIENLQSWVSGDKLRSLDKYLVPPSSKKQGYPAEVILEIHGERP